MMKKVVVGMSGGVDSSLTAYLLKEQGYEVEGVSFILYESRFTAGASGCCSLESINDARKTAEHIGVKHTVVDLREEFLERVIEPFIDDYNRGVTPNPCIFCNKHIKFPRLLKFADEIDAFNIATGHYARAEAFSPSTFPPFRTFALRKGLDPRKDQSYVLYVLRQEELSRLILPLGGMTKTEVRRMAGMLNLPAAKRPESQEICFTGDKNYCRFMEGLSERMDGRIVDVETGESPGSHKGIHLYTVGQRKRIGVAVGKPRYVTGIDPAHNVIYIGPREAAMRKAFEVDEINWLVPLTAHSFSATVKVRSTMKDEPATITIADADRRSAEVVFDEPQWAPAPGQSAVFYDGDIVLGGGTIQQNCKSEIRNSKSEINSNDQNSK
jgi:tRNA-specific 2-thiouridylase